MVGAAKLQVRRSGGQGQGVNGNSTPAVGPIETMVPGLPGHGCNCNSTPAVGPIETIVPGLPGHDHLR